MHGSVWFGMHEASPSTILKARAPAYIQRRVPEHMHGQGFGLHDHAVFAATLSDLIHAMQNYNPFERWSGFTWL